MAFSVRQRYPILWEGELALKGAKACVQMHFVCGNPKIARASLPLIIDGECEPLRIRQRMRMGAAQLDGVSSKMQLTDEHCVLMAMPCGKDQRHLVQQASNLKLDFISYFLNKGAAGIVNVAAPGTQQPAFVIHFLPSSDFTQDNIGRIAPTLLDRVRDIPHLVTIIAAV